MTMTPDEALVLDAIRRHSGRANGIAGKSLAEQLNIRHRLLRECVESLISTHGVLIGSDPLNGYYLITSEDEFNQFDMYAIFGALSGMMLLVRWFMMRTSRERT